MKKIKFLIIVLFLGGLLISTTNSVGAIHKDEQFVVSKSKKSSLKSGVFGTSPWYFTDTGELHIESGVWPQEKDAGTVGSWDTELTLAERDQIQKIIFDGKVQAGESIDLGLLSEFKNLTEIENLTFLDIGKTTSLARTFSKNPKLVSLDVSKLHSLVLMNLSFMFEGDSSLKMINLSNLSEVSIQYLNYAFAGTTSLEKIDLSGIDNLKLVQMDDIFLNSSVKEIVLGKNFIFKNTIGDFNLRKGTWQNISNGTISNLLGKNIWSTDELTSNYDGNLDADTYYLKGGDITVSYKDEAGNDLHSAQSISGAIDAPYDLTTSDYQLSFDGYQIDQSKFPDNLKGRFTENSPLNVIYTYKKIIPAADITVKYVDTLGNEIHDPQTISGNVGDSYDATSPELELSEIITDPDEPTKKIRHVIDDTNIPNDSKGVFSDTPHTITFTYLAMIPIRLAWRNESDNSVIHDEIVQTLKEGEAYDFTEKSNTLFDGFKLDKNKFPENVKGVAKKEEMSGTQIYIVFYMKKRVFGFENTPATLEFDNSKISTSTQKVKRKDADWKIEVEDSRTADEKKNSWRVTAKLVNSFEDSKGDKLKNSILYYGDENQPENGQIIDSQASVDVFDGQSSDDTDEYEVKWSENAGVYLKVDPGTVKSDQYHCSVQWILENTP